MLVRCTHSTLHFLHTVATYLGSQNSRCVMICGPFSHLLAFLRSMYRNTICRNDRWRSRQGLTLLALVTHSSATMRSHCIEHGCGVLPAGKGVNSCCQMGLECMHKKFISTSKLLVRLISSCILHSDPRCDGFPQKIEKTTHKLSHRSGNHVCFIHVYTFLSNKCTPGISFDLPVTSSNLFACELISNYNLQQDGFASIPTTCVVSSHVFCL